jgi:hypothetical protein
MIQIACSHGCDDGDQVGDGDHCHQFVPGVIAKPMGEQQRMVDFCLRDPNSPWRSEPRCSHRRSSWSFCRCRAPSGSGGRGSLPADARCLASRRTHAKSGQITFSKYWHDLSEFQSSTRLDIKRGTHDLAGRSVARRGRLSSSADFTP